MEKETLEQAAEKYVDTFYKGESYERDIEEAVIFGAKWQAERMYSEDEVLELLNNCRGENPIDVSDWFNQNKKK